MDRKLRGPQGGAMERRLPIRRPWLGLGLLVTILAAAGTVAGGCATATVHPTSSFYQQDHAAALAAWESAAATKSNDQALQSLRCASACLSSGDYRKACEYLTLGTGIMEDFRADGEFQARVGEESAKEYRGDPYEKMLAFFYLGLLHYGEEDYEKALAAFKTAALADAGTKEERFRSDSVAVYLMTGLAAQRLHEEEYARKAFELAARVERFKCVVGAVEQALVTSRDGLIQSRAKGWSAGTIRTRLQAATGAIHGRVSAAATESTDPLAVLRSAYEEALISLESPEFIKQEGSEEIRGFAKEVYQDAEQRLTATTQTLEQELREAGGAETFVRKTSQLNPNLLVVVETGKAPYKARRGRYQQELCYGRQISDVDAVRVSLGERELPSMKVEDVYFQASTRGARKMDEINATKAAFKDAFGFLAIFDPTGAMFLTFLATTPRADCRHWDTLPDALHLAAENVPPGTYPVRVEYLARNGRVLSGKTVQHQQVVIHPGRQYVLLVREQPAKAPNTWLVSMHGDASPALPPADAQANKE